MDIYEDVTRRVSAPLRALGHDTLHADDAGHKGRTDPQQLAFVTAQGRVMVTCNLKDFLLLHEAWLLCPPDHGDRRHSLHAGIAIVPNSSRISDAEFVSIVDRFAREVATPAGRLFRWRRDRGWQEIGESDAGSPLAQSSGT